MIKYLCVELNLMTGKALVNIKHHYYQLYVDFCIMYVSVEEGVTGWTNGLAEGGPVVPVAGGAVGPGH